MNKSESDTLISESDVPKMLTEYGVVAFALIMQEEYHKALQLLSQSEELLEAVTSQGGNVDLDFILLTVHNSAYCYMKLGKLKECASYIDACIYNSESKKLMGPELAGPQFHLSNLKKEKYEALVHLFYSLLLSQLKNHEESLKHAQTAFKKSLLCMKILYKLCIDHLSRHTKLISTDSIRKRLLRQSQYKLIESPHYQSFHRIVNSSMPFLQYFHNKYHSTSSKPLKLSLKSYTQSFYSDDNWVLSTTFDEISNLKPLNPMNLHNTSSIESELSKESMAHKLLAIISSMFSIATELKLTQKEEAKAWHKQTIKSASELLPPTSMIIKQLKDSFIKEYKILNTIHKNSRRNTFSTRVRTPMPGSHQTTSKNKSNHDKTLDNSRIKSPHIPKHPQSQSRDYKTSNTPQPQLGTSLIKERKRSKIDSEDFKAPDLNFSIHDFY